MRDPAGWDPTDCMLNVPRLDAPTMKPGRVQWSDWLPPVLLLEFEAADGRIVRLCDFGSAGEAGTPYLSWLPIKPTGSFYRALPMIRRPTPGELPPCQARFHHKPRTNIQRTTMGL